MCVLVSPEMFVCLHLIGQVTVDQFRAQLEGDKNLRTLVFAVLMCEGMNDSNLK